MFGFWGAEESGLWGSRAYVRSRANVQTRRRLPQLRHARHRRVRRGVYRGPFAATFERYFAQRGSSRRTLDLGGRSDHAPFAASGDPRRRALQRQDPCYHRRCDRVANVNQGGLHELADAAAHGVALLAPR